MRELLEPLPMPVYVLPGNHDEPGRARRGLRRAGGRAAAGRVRPAPIPGRDDGEVDLDWLAATLVEDRETPTIVAMHHPPILTGIGGLDAIGRLRGNREALGALLERSAAGPAA